MASGIAHELSQPLQYVVLALGRLQRFEKQRQTKESHGAKSAELLTESLRQTDRAATILSQMLRLSRDDKTETTLNPIELPALIEQSLILIRHTLETENIKLGKTFADDLPKIEGNANQLEQVLMNLLRNAIQALEGQTHPREILINIQPARALPDSPEVLRLSPWVEIEISDTGTGIPQENLDRLTEPFFTTKPPGEGTGLGLAVCQQIIESHGGTIHFSNREEGGARITVQFPGI
jgi:signal transduction histidine kinase